MTGKSNLSAVIRDSSYLYIFLRGNKISMGIQQKQGGASALNANSAGKTFSWRRPFCLAEQRFSEVYHAASGSKMSRGNGWWSSFCDDEL